MTDDHRTISGAIMVDEPQQGEMQEGLLSIFVDQNGIEQAKLCSNEHREGTPKYRIIPVKNSVNHEQFEELIKTVEEILLNDEALICNQHSKRISLMSFDQAIVAIDTLFQTLPKNPQNALSLKRF